MSEHKQEKWLYTFIISKEIESEKLIEETVNGEVVKVMRKVKEKQDFSFALKRPNRRLYERGDLFYGVQLAEGIRAGLLTKALLLKRYREDGGALSEGDSRLFDSLLTKLNELELQHQRFLVNLDKLTPEENAKRVETVFNEKTNVLQQLQAFETINRALFSHTAESKADVQLANWWTVHLAYWDEKADNNFTEFFQGATFEDRMKQWDEMYDKNEDFLLTALARFSLLISVWLAGAATPEDFKTVEKQQMPEAEKPKETPPPSPTETPAAS